MNRKAWLVGVVLVCLSVGFSAMAGTEGIGAEEALAKLRALQGDWNAAKSTEAASRHAFRLSAGGTVVMETMFPGTEHEMVNMYHLDGDDLMLTHYCSQGNQPRMRLDRAASSVERLVFEFAGGSNFDPAKDAHIHSAQLKFVGSGLSSEWISWKDGKQDHAMTFDLVRE